MLFGQREKKKAARWQKIQDRVRTGFNRFRYGNAASSSRSGVCQAQESVRCTINERLLSLNSAIVRFVLNQRASPPEADAAPDAPAPELEEAMDWESFPPPSLEEIGASPAHQELQAEEDELDFPPPPNLSFTDIVQVALERARTPPDVLFQLSPEDFEVEADTPRVSRDVSVGPSEIVLSSDVSELSDVSEVSSSISPLFLSPFVLSPLDSPEYQPSEPAEVSEGPLESSSFVDFLEEPVHAAVEPDEDEAGPSTPLHPPFVEPRQNHAALALSQVRKTTTVQSQSIAGSTDLTLTATQNLGHNHPPELAAVAIRSQVASMKAEARTNVQEVTRDVVWCTRDRVRLEAQEEGLIQIPSIPAMRKAIQRQRYVAGRAQLDVRNINDVVFNDVFRSLGQYGEERFLYWDSRTQNPNLPVVWLFITDNGIARLQEHREWCGDGTFTFLPNFLRQLYTVGVMVDGHMVPAAFALMQNKDQPSYTRTLHKIREAAGVEPTHFTADFEIAAKQAFETVFPNSVRKGCLFHLGQAVWRHTNTGPRNHRGLYDDLTRNFRKLVRSMTKVSHNLVDNQRFPVIIEERSGETD
ncbi:hypothetical protein L596_009503 [Steinernema carpocapsae]|uniref:MULE transposase domain-containing protein n=1 Tax=Steinernema carpocapsae TaxID=34508 RepID=A0A4U5PFJ2_STECR|nr:hypothetical protein L596_009503 [Steinernema carpocapsae]